MKIFSGHKTAASIILFNFILCTFLGDWTHHIVHHFQDLHHGHELHCLINALTETPSDERPSNLPGHALTSNACPLKIVLGHVAKAFSPHFTLTALLGPVLQGKDHFTSLLQSRPHLRSFLQIWPRGPPSTDEHGLMT